MNYDLQKWRTNAQEILKGKPYSLKLTKTIIAVAKFVIDNNWQGACHAVSALLYVLCREQGIVADLCIGEVQFGDIVFNHSWLEIDNEIYDVAIMSTLDNRFSFPPTIRSLNIEPMRITELMYGVKTGLTDDEPTRIIKSTSFLSFMENFPNHQEGLWGFVKIIQEKLGNSFAHKPISSKFSSVKWISR